MRLRQHATRERDTKAAAAQEDPAQDDAAQDDAAQDDAAQDDAAQDTAAQGTAVEDIAAQGTAVEDTPAQDTAAQEPTVHNAGDLDAGTHETDTLDTGTSETGGQDPGENLVAAIPEGRGEASGLEVTGTQVGDAEAGDAGASGTKVSAAEATDAGDADTEIAATEVSDTGPEGSGSEDTASEDTGTPDAWRDTRPGGTEVANSDPTVALAADPHEPHSHAADELKIKGAMLVRVRGMTPEERAAEGWKDYPEDVPAIEYDNGAVLYPACERCDRPGTIYANYAGGRWGITGTGEPYHRAAVKKRTPRWVYSAIAFAVVLLALSAAGAFTLWKVNQDQRDQVQQQSQIIRQQRAMMARQLDSQRTIQRIIRGNQDDLRRSLRDLGGKIDGVVNERDALRAGNAQLQQQINQLQGQLRSRRGGGGGGGR